MNERSERNDSGSMALAMVAFLLVLLVLSLMNISKIAWEYSQAVETLLIYAGPACVFVGLIYVVLNRKKSGLIYSLCGLIYIMSSVAI